MPLDRTAIIARIERSAAVIAALREQPDAVARLIDEVTVCFARGGTLYTCGNGGSAAEALHLAEELIGRYKRDRRPFPAVCLAADPTAITCIANDYGFEQIFSRQIHALGRPGDALFAFSTSGKSRNITLALQSARAKGVRTIALLGKAGGEALQHCDAALVVDADETEHIQEAHQVLLHLILEAVEA